MNNAVTEAFATALFSMSEIAFDRENTILPLSATPSGAVFCCANGSTIVFENSDGVCGKTQTVTVADGFLSG